MNFQSDDLMSIDGKGVPTAGAVEVINPAAGRRFVLAENGTQGRLKRPAPQAVHVAKG